MSAPTRPTGLRPWLPHLVALGCMLGAGLWHLATHRSRAELEAAKRDNKGRHE